MKVSLSYRIVIALGFLLSTSCTQAVNKAAKAEANHATDTTQTAPAPKPAWHPAAVQEVVKVNSAAMGEVSNTVTLPATYMAASDTTHYPVVYLLHGFGDNHTEWAKQTDLKAAANKYGIIIVCPDGQTSWYFDSPVNPKLRYETYISTELVQWVDSHYRTRAHRSGRAITGLSMGGHGALWNAFRHPDVWGSCGSMSGGVDITKFPDRWHLHHALGKYAQHKQSWAEHSVINLVPSLQAGKQNIIIDDGRQDFFYEVNMALHQALSQKGIAHSFTIRPGQHSWRYWCESLPQHLAFFKTAFDGKPVKCITTIDDSAPAKKTPASPTTQKKAPTKKALKKDSL
ncbi:MAG: alpha/beta hydrolase-fold protein [Sodaliphilus sp.]